MENSEASDLLFARERIESVINALFGVYGRLRLKEEKTQNFNPTLIEKWTESSVKISSLKSKMNELIRIENFKELDSELNTAEQNLRDLISLEHSKYSEIYAGQ